jgi:hypothetical protein
MGIAAANAAGDDASPRLALHREYTHGDIHRKGCGASSRTR